MRSLRVVLLAAEQGDRVSHWKWDGLIVVGALLLTCRSLGAGWELDDLVHREYLLTGSKSIWDMFGFLKADPQITAGLMAEGKLPWWTLPELRVNFFRPLASLSHGLDYALWPDSAASMHAHSLVWFAACVAVAARLYRRFIDQPLIAGMAAVLFAYDDAHAIPVLWLANRNVLIAFFFGGMALLCHDRWRRNAWRPGSWLAPLCLALSLCGAEAGVATAGYLTAYALFIDRASWSSRVRSLIPALVVGLVWKVMYSSMGCGSWGSGFYTDPGSEPFRFAACVAERGPVLLMMQFFLPMSVDPLMALFGPSERWIIAGWVSVAVIGLIIASMIRSDRTARFWSLGMMLAIIPVCATIPMSRLLFFAGLGAFGVVASWVGAVGRMSPGPIRTVCRGVLGTLLLIHAGAAPVGLWLHTKELVPADSRAKIFVEIEAQQNSTSQILFVLNSPSVFHGQHRAIQMADASETLRFVAPSWCDVEVERRDDTTFVVRPEGGFLRRPMDALFRGAHHRMPNGHRVELPESVIEVTALTPDGRPAEIVVRCDRSLDHPDFVWVAWREGEYRLIDAPRVHEVLQLAEPTLLE
jgi:hypothetical protein